MIYAALLEGISEMANRKITPANNVYEIMARTMAVQQKIKTTPQHHFEKPHKWINTLVLQSTLELPDSLAG